MGWHTQQRVQHNDGQAQSEGAQTACALWAESQEFALLRLARQYNFTSLTWGWEGLLFCGF